MMMGIRVSIASHSTLCGFQNKKSKVSLLFNLSLPSLPNETPENNLLLDSLSQDWPPLNSATRIFFNFYILLKIPFILKKMP